MAASSVRLMVIDHLGTMLYGNAGRSRTEEECRRFLALYNEMRRAADPGIFHTAMVYRYHTVTGQKWEAPGIDPAERHSGVLTRFDSPR